MKKLNRKGFTLVELLAVIIILAIVVGISIPAITNIINDSKNNSLGVAVDAAEKYVSDQYALMSVDYNLIDSEFKAVVPSLYTADTTTTLKVATANHANLLKKMGLETTNVNEVSMTIKTNGAVCITVSKILSTSDYYSTAHWNTATNTTTAVAPKATALNKSKGC